jgi:hypothetical protein
VWNWSSNISLKNISSGTLRQFLPLNLWTNVFYLRVSALSEISQEGNDSEHSYMPHINNNGATSNGVNVQSLVIMAQLFTKRPRTRVHLVGSQ